MQLHLVDATYELFRAHFAPRPPVLGRDGIVLSGVSGLCDQLLYLLREEGATHVGCATDRVIESFRNDLYPGYKSSAGMPPELLAQFPIAEAAVEALGIVLWPMVEFEADDAIAAAAVALRRGPGGRADRRLHARQGHGPARRGERVVLWDRRRASTYDEAGVRAKWGVAAGLDPRLARPRRRLVGWLPGHPRLGREVGGGGPRPATATSRTSRPRPPPGRCPGVGGAPGDEPGGVAPRALGRGDAVPRPRPAADRGRRRPIRQHDPDELRWDGAPRAAGRRSATSGASTGCGRRPHRWLED